MQKEKNTVAHFPPPDLIGLKVMLVLLRRFLQNSSIKKVPDVWLVGYGLDDRQEKRGWSHLFGVPKLPEVFIFASELVRVSY